MVAIIRVADGKGRVTLPGFANATVILEAVSPNEYRVRKGNVIAADDLTFSEEKMPISFGERCPSPEKCSGETAPTECCRASGRQATSEEPDTFEEPLTR